MSHAITTSPTTADRDARRHGCAAPDREYGVEALARACRGLARLLRGLRRERNDLSALSDHLLRDIGLTRDDVLDPFEKASPHLREHD